MTTNQETRNAQVKGGGRLIDDMEFLERLEAGFVTDEERRKFAMELVADDDARARYLTMHEMGLFGEIVEDESEEENETEVDVETSTGIVATVNTGQAPSTTKRPLARFVPWVAAAVILIAVGVYFIPNPTNQPCGPTEPVASRFQPGELALGKWYALNGASLWMGLGERKINVVDLTKTTDSERFDYIVKAIALDSDGLANSTAARKAYDACSDEAKESGDGKLLLGLIEFDSKRFDEAERAFRDAAESYEKAGSTLMFEEARFDLAMTLVSQSFDSKIEDAQVRAAKKQEAKAIYESLSPAYRQKLPYRTQRELENLDDNLE